MNASNYRASYLVVLVLAIFLIALFLGQIWKLEIARDWITGILSPLQYCLTQVTKPLNRFSALVRKFGHLPDENERLREEVRRLQGELELLREAVIENQHLREQLRFERDNPSFKMLPTEVIGRDPSNLLRFIHVDRGKLDGVVRGMPVITPEGLVGRVTRVQDSSSMIMLLTDASSSVSGILRDSRATCMVQGRTGRNPVMNYIPHDATVTVGDAVLTSGLGGNFPKRLLIGYVIKVQRRDIDMFQEAEVQPAVDFNRLETVMILLNFSPADSETGFRNLAFEENRVS